MTPKNAFEFDVALSFLRGDLETALALAEHLEPELRVMVHARSRESAAGGDELEKQRAAFGEHARLSLVLFRNGWGDTPWTASEESAIRERCVASGYRSLLLVRLDTAPLPAWLPQGFLAVDAELYPTEQLIGVIKARAQELGAQLQRASAAERAAALEQRRAYDAETARQLAAGTAEWLAARSTLVDALEAHAQEVAARTGWELESGRGAGIGGHVVVLQGQSIQLADCQLSDTARDAYLELREYDARLPVERAGASSSAAAEPAVARRTRIDIRRLPALGWCWQIDGRVRPTIEAAEAIVTRLRERVERELRPKSWEP